jgi:hypothetical protein
LRIVETAAAIVACAVALALGLIAGLRVPIGHRPAAPGTACSIAG